MLTGHDSGNKPIIATDNSMNLVINGEDHHDLPEPLTVQGLILHLGLPAKKIAIERNREIVPKSTFETALLADGDVLEIIHFIGGG
jgi:thiamine biosynthesis protein ThiS